MSVLKTNTYSINKKNKADGLMLLADINDKTIATAFFDPQYRGVLDKLKYGNEGQARGKARCELARTAGICFFGWISFISVRAYWIGSPTLILIL